jgi:hypothetical protein
VIKCPNCGTENPDGSRFCAECGADLRSFGQTPPAGAPPQAPPFQGAFDQASGAPTPIPGWTPGPTYTLEPEKRRRTWLWIVLGIVAGCIICCCVFTIWANTGGQSVIEDWGTRLADEIEEVSRTPTPRR